MKNVLKYNEIFLHPKIKTYINEIIEFLMHILQTRSLQSSL